MATGSERTRTLAGDGSFRICPLVEVEPTTVDAVERISVRDHEGHVIEPLSRRLEHGGSESQRSLDLAPRIGGVEVKVKPVGLLRPDGILLEGEVRSLLVRIVPLGPILGFRAHELVPERCRPELNYLLLFLKSRTIDPTQVLPVAAIPMGHKVEQVGLPTTRSARNPNVQAGRAHGRSASTQP